MSVQQTCVDAGVRALQADVMASAAASDAMPALPAPLVAAAPAISAARASAASDANAAVPRVRTPNLLRSATQYTYASTCVSLPAEKVHVCAPRQSRLRSAMRFADFTSSHSVCAAKPYVCALDHACTRH